MGCGWSTPHPGRFTAGKETRYPLYRRPVGSRSRSGRVRKISPPIWIRSPYLPARCESQYRLSYRGPHRCGYIFCKSSTHFKTVGVRMVKGQTFRAEYLQTFGAKVQNLVATVSWRPGFVHPWLLELHSTHLKVSR